ncbi:hypothetical protein [Desertivirga xinjiangensis]|uniref:hypothetical protein n=1 Tax=Desertivirga xinjiangensis TaxID=539206 RepID=UPI002109EBB2|nr:hypothetical protein [Pedobacter xinjiangensis]
MSGLKATHPVSLQYLMTEELYLIDPIDLEAVKDVSQTNIRESQAESPAPPPQPSFDYLGENNKYFLLLVDYPGHQVMAPKELEALQSILTAKKMSLGDVAVMNVATNPAASLQQLKTFFACSKVVLFGLNPERFGLPALSPNKISEHEGIQLLNTFNFSEMLNDVEKKKIFWNVMKGF